MSTTVTCTMTTYSQGSEDLGTSFITGPSTLTFYNGSYCAFQYFGVAVPHGATVSSAILSVYASSLKNAPETGTMCCLNGDNYPVTFNTAGQVANAAKTVSSATQTITSTTSYTPLDVTACVQQVVNRAGWASGNGLAVVSNEDWTNSAGGGNTSCKIDNWTSSSPATDPYLTITYTTGGSGPPALPTDTFMAFF